MVEETVVADVPVVCENPLCLGVTWCVSVGPVVRWPSVVFISTELLLRTWLR